MGTVETVCPALTLSFYSEATDHPASGLAICKRTMLRIEKSFKTFDKYYAGREKTLAGACAPRSID
jgi:hypothetical protein